MAIADPYISTTELKQRMKIDDARSDDLLASSILAASRMIDEWTGRSFNYTDAATARFFTSRNGWTLLVPDLVSVTEIATDTGNRTYSTIWSASDYDLWPYDADEFGKPYSQIKVAPQGSRVFPSAPKGVRVTGRWGWPAVPSQIIEACAIQAHRLWKRGAAPFGVTGSQELGQVVALTAMDPDVKAIVAPFKRMAV